MGEVVLSESDVAPDGKSIATALNDLAGLQSVHASDDAHFWEARYIRLLGEAKDVTDFSNRVRRALSEMGFEHYSLARLMAPGDIELEFQTVPQEVNASYKEGGFFADDVVIKHSMRQKTPIYKSTVEKCLRDTAFSSPIVDRNLELNRMLSSYGFFNFYYIPISAANSNGCVMIAVTARDLDPVEFVRRIEKCKIKLQALGKAADYIGTTKYPAYFLSEAENRGDIIAPDSLRLLRLLIKKDLSIKEAAHELNWHRTTVDRHLKLIREAFGTKTNLRAAYLAQKFELIDSD